jgi:cell division protein FtsI/penicillin-binding protein 2
MTRRGSRYVAPLEGGGVAELTLSAPLQEAAEEIFRAFDVPLGAAVAISIPDGRVLALAGRASSDPSLGAADLALRPWAPAASVFKIVAASALVSQAGLSAGTRACYHGGVSGLGADNLIDMPRLDRRCETLGFGIGKSQNALIAKLVSRNLKPEQLERVATAFRFGEAIPFEMEVEPSEVEIPRAPLEFARAAAGFWHSSLSALHGALIAASVAGGGEMPAPRLVSKAVGPDGKILPLPRRRSLRVLDAATAGEVGHMMELTTRIGTAKASFRDRRGNRYLPVEVAGKTGSLSYRGAPGDPMLPVLLPPEHYLGYSWFVGYAPVDKPKIAFAVVIGNRATWHIKAPYVARRLIAEYLAAGGDTRAAKMLAAR